MKTLTLSILLSSFIATTVTLAKTPSTEIPTEIPHFAQSDSSGKFPSRYKNFWSKQNLERMEVDGMKPSEVIIFYSGLEARIVDRVEALKLHYEDKYRRLKRCDQ